MLAKSSLCMVFVLVSAFTGNSLLQDSNPNQEATNSQEAATNSPPATENSQYGPNETDLLRQSYLDLMGGENNVDAEIRRAAEQLRTAESSSERQEAEESLRRLLSDDYDNRLNDYEKYLDQLEQRLSEMRSKLTRRREAKSKMIDLRIKVLEAEADDLGWPSRVSNYPKANVSNFGNTPE